METITTVFDGRVRSLSDVTALQPADRQHRSSLQHNAGGCDTTSESEASLYARATRLDIVYSE